MFCLKHLIVLLEMSQSFQYKFLEYLEYYYDICRPIEMGANENEE